MKLTSAFLTVLRPQLYLAFSRSCSVHRRRPTRENGEKSKGGKRKETSRKIDIQRVRAEAEEEAFHSNF